MTTITPIIPASGIISMSNIVMAFPGIGSNLGSYYSKHPSLPTSSQINLSMFHGLTALTPAFSTFNSATSTGTNMSLAANGIISGNTGGSLTLNVASYLDNASYHGTCTYTLTSGSWPTGVSMSNGTITLTPSVTSSTSVTVTCTNRYGNYQTIGLTFNITSPSAAMPSNYKYAFVLSELTGKGNASAVSSFGTYTQTVTANKPTYYTSGGYNNKPYVQFTSAVASQLLNPVQVTYRFDLGFTVMMLMKPTETGSQNKNNYARYMSIMFAGGGFTEICRNGTTNDLQFFIYSNGTYLGANTSSGASLVTNQWALYVFRYRGDTKVIEIKWIQLGTVLTNISSISQFTTAATTTGTVAFPTSALAVASQNAFQSYINTTNQTPADQFGGGFVFDRLVTDADILGAANYLLSQ